MEGLKAAYGKFSNLSVAAKIIFALLTILIIAYFISISKKGGDFASYLEAASKMLNGTNIYDPPYVHLRYSYSPLWAMVLMPLAILPLSTGVFIWLVINVFLLCRTIILLRGYFDVRFDEPKKDMALWFGIILFMSRFIELNFHHSQMTIFLLWIMLESIRLSANGNDISAGILTGLGTIIKIMPIVMIPYFVYRRKFKVAFTAVITAIIGFFLPILYVGRVRFIELNTSWVQILRPDSSDFQPDNVGYFPHNLSALLYRLFMKTDAPYIRNIFAMDFDTATRWVWATIALLIVFTIYFLATKPFREVKSKNHILYETSYIFMIIPLIFPHQMKYAFYFLLPAVCCLVKSILVQYHSGDRGNRFRLTMALVIVSFILCTMTTDLLLGMDYSIITQYLKTITFGALLLIPALVIQRPYFIGKFE